MSDRKRNRFRVRAIGPIVQAAGLVPWSVAGVVLFVVASAVVAAVEPGVGGFGDAAWLMFQVVTTIGLGDFTCVTPMGRAATVVLSVYSVFLLALLTGVVVSFCSERMRVRQEQSVAQFLDQLEHLPELSPQELAELSQKVRRLR